MLFNNRYEPPARFGDFASEFDNDPVSRYGGIFERGGLLRRFRAGAVSALFQQDQEKAAAAVSVSGVTSIFISQIP